MVALVGKDVDIDCESVGRNGALNLSKQWEAERYLSSD
jgi:hypothetical protein